MADLERYEIAGSLLLCRTCGMDGTRRIVKDFGHQTIDVAEIHTEIFIHKTNHHEVVFENNATENAETAKRVSRELARCASNVTFELRENDYYRRYPSATAYRDGMRDGMGGPVGEMAGLLGPEVARALSRALERVAEMGKDYPELIQDHNRKICDDFMCIIYGDLIDTARAVDGRLPN